MERLNQRIPELDGLRGIAIAMVMLFHARPESVEMFGPLPSLYNTLALGANGVDLFFVLSGFLITGILLDSRGMPRYFSAFYKRRFLRIVPIYFVAVFAYFYIMLPWLHSYGSWLQVSTGESIWYWTFLMNWRDVAGHLVLGMSHLWSLGIEEQFYLVWPAIVFFCAARYFPALCVAIGASSVALRIALYAGGFVSPGGIAEWVHRATLTRLDTLAVGALIAVIVRNREWALVARSWVKIVAPAAFVFYVLFWAANFERFCNTLGFTILAIGFGCAVLVCVMDQGSDHVFCRITRVRVLQSMGRYSYAMYVIHIAVNFGLNILLFNHILPHIDPALTGRIPALLATFIIMSSCFAVTYVGAFISWHALEKHFLRLKDRFASQQVAPVAQAQAVSAD